MCRPKPLPTSRNKLRGCKEYTRKYKIPPQAPKGDVKSGMRDDLNAAPSPFRQVGINCGDVKSGMRDESEKSTTVTAPFRGLGADVGDESNL
jgi:hypothetical protein